MNNVRAIFIDSEGTLRDEKKKISVEVIETIKKLENIGIHVIVTTGLPRFLSRNICLNAGASKYLISSNGADIYDILHRENIKSSYINQKIIEEIYNLSNLDYNLILGAGEFEYSNSTNEYNLSAKSIGNIHLLENGIYQLHISQRIVDLKQDDYLTEIKNFMKYDDLLKLRLLIGEEFFSKISNLKISSLSKDELSILIRAIRYVKLFDLRTAILKEYGEFVTIGNQSLDFSKFQMQGETPWFSLNKKGVSKGLAIQYLCEYLKIDLKDTIGIGNDYNDNSMIDSVGTFICPNNARDYLREKTNFRYSNEEGVSKILKKVYERR